MTTYATPMGGTYNPGNLREHTRAMRIRIRALRLGGSFANSEPVTRIKEAGNERI